MSVLNYVKTKQSFEFNYLQNIIKNEFEAVEFKQRSPKLCFVWLDGVSTRGVDVSIEGENWIELRNNALSSDGDYHLTNLLADVICKIFDGSLFKINEEFDEEKDAPELAFLPITYPLYSDDYMATQFQKDARTLELMVEAAGCITIFGPLKKVHFGPRFFAPLKSVSEEKRVAFMRQTILAINYAYPEYAYGNVIETGEGENKVILKLITNKGNCMIDQYDFVLFASSEETQIALTNETLNTILPEQWELLDEYTILAPVLPEKDFLELVQRTLTVNEFHLFENRIR